MGSYRAKATLCACLAAASSSTVYAFTPPVSNAGCVGGTRARSSDDRRAFHDASRQRSRVSAAAERNSSGVGGGGRVGSKANANSIMKPSDALTNLAGGSVAGSVSSPVSGKTMGLPLPTASAGASIGGEFTGTKRTKFAFIGRRRPAMALGSAERGQAGVSVGEGAAVGDDLATSPGAILATANRTERGQRLRVLNWVKQVRNDLTSAEFAVNLNAPALNGTARRQPSSDAKGDDSRSTTAAAAAAGGASKRVRDEGSVKSKIDYDSIAERLEASLRTLQAGRPLSLMEVISQDELQELTDRLKTNLSKIKKIDQAEAGKRIGNTSEMAATVASSKTSKEVPQASGEPAEDGVSWRDPGAGILDEMKGGINVNLKDVKVPEFDLFVRDDGTVDWDGAIQSGREVARFGQELWDRINGQNPHEDGAPAGAHGAGGERPPKEIPEDSPVMLDLARVGVKLEERLDQLVKELDALKADARAQEAAWEGLDRRNAQRRIREKEAQVDGAKRQLQLHRIDVDMERICYNIEQEIRESTVSSSSEYRLLVAEFGLLDAQLANLTKQVAEMTGGQSKDELDSPDRVVIDEDELELVSREVQDLKNRLGMDLENPALSIDPEKVSRYMKETYEKIKNGVDFYWTGTKILGSDIGYALTLVSKAVQGSILNPREVRTLRRTAKDCMTFIPFVIILIFPLTPVGHVLVFSFIQRFFPDFFPSTYTDRRQNLLKMYTEVEKKVDWDEADPSTAGDGGEDMLEALRRNFIATLNQAGDQGKGDKRKSR